MGVRYQTTVGVILPQKGDLTRMSFPRSLSSCRRGAGIQGRRGANRPVSLRVLHSGKDPQKGDEAISTMSHELSFRRRNSGCQVPDLTRKTEVQVTDEFHPPVIPSPFDGRGLG